MLVLLGILPLLACGARVLACVIAFQLFSHVELVAKFCEFFAADCDLMGRSATHLEQKINFDSKCLH